MDNSFLSWTIRDISEIYTDKNAERGWIVGIYSLKVRFKEFKIHLCRVYEAVCGGLKKNKEISTYIGYVIHQLSFQDLWIDDLERDIKELIGKIDRISKDVLKKINFTQSNHYHETTAFGAQRMEEVSVSNPIPSMERKKKK